MATFDPQVFVAKYGHGSTLEFDPGQTIFSQGQSADALFILLEGQVQLSVVSEDGRETIIAVLPRESMFGEGCLAGHPLRMSMATTMIKSVVTRIEKAVAVQALHDDPAFSQYVVAQLLNESIILKERLIDHRFNTSEKRLARILLMLANYNTGGTQLSLPKIDQETLSKMVGTTRGRVSHFMNKFREMGLIEYNNEILINSAMLEIVLTDARRDRELRAKS